MRPTRQSLTERNGIPERSLEKQREAVCVLHARHHLVLLVSCPRIKQQAGANKSVCSCLFASGGLIRPTSLLGGVSTILRTASRFFIRSLCAFCRSYTGSDEKNTHPGRAERRLRLAGQPTKSFVGRSAPPFSVFLQRTRWLVLQTRKKCAIISVSKR